MKPQQLTFPSLEFGKDRTVFYPHECAAKLRVTTQHIIDLIAEGKINAINIAGANATDRRYWRIPVEAWRKYLSENLSINDPDL